MIYIFSTEYERPDIGGHLFPLAKYRLVKERLLAKKKAVESDFKAPSKACLEDLLLTHDRKYLEKLFSGKLSFSERLKLEMPFSKQLFESFLYCTDGTIKACETAHYHNVGFHLGGGFHHAFSGHGEGFCILNDIAVAVKKLLVSGRAGRIMIVDCDLHQGNGTASIFTDEPHVFTFSMHQNNIYPYPKEKSSLDIDLPPGVDDTEYNEILKTNLKKIIRDFKPDFAFYVAGADPFNGDLLSGLSLTIDGLRKRDGIVMKYIKGANLPVVVTLAGGYAARLEDTVEIHYNTCIEAEKYFI